MNNNTQNTDIASISNNELCIKSLNELKKYDIPPIPKCYEVMYEYFKGDNMEVEKAFMKYLESGGNVNADFLCKVHTSILSYDTIARTVDTVTSMLTAQILGLNDSVSSSDQELSVFNNALDTFSKQIAAYENTQVVDCIASATQRVQEKIKELEGNLEISQAEMKKLQNYLENMRQEATIDSLTSLSTRKRFDQVLSKSIRTSLETSEKVSVVFLEVDHYPAFKDKWGQVTSEQILRFTASTLKENIKGRDIAARYSESLFAIILPNTNSDGAESLTEHIRNTIERKRIVKKTTGEFLGRVTVCAGIAEFQSGDSIGYLLSRAERCLNTARQNGRNCSMTETKALEFMKQSEQAKAIQNKEAS